MKDESIRICAGRNLPPAPVVAMFRRVGLNDWFTRADAAWYLRHALHVVSAWAGRRCVGMVVLAGDGRINAAIDFLGIDPDWRRRGIGSQLMQRAVAKVEQLKPYHFAVEVYQRSAERFYAHFGFERNRGTWLLQHAPTARRLHRTASAARRRR